jgi:hypothetical protein
MIRTKQLLARSVAAGTIALVGVTSSCMRTGSATEPEAVGEASVERRDSLVGHTWACGDEGSYATLSFLDGWTVIQEGDDEAPLVRSTSYGPNGLSVVTWDGRPLSEDGSSVALEAGQLRVVWDGEVVPCRAAPTMNHAMTPCGIIDDVASVAFQMEYVPLQDSPIELRALMLCQPVQTRLASLLGALENAPTSDHARLITAAAAHDAAVVERTCGTPIHEVLGLLVAEDTGASARALWQACNLARHHGISAEDVPLNTRWRTVLMWILMVDDLPSDGPAAELVEGLARRVFAADGSRLYQMMRDQLDQRVRSDGHRDGVAEHLAWARLQASAMGPVTVSPSGTHLVPAFDQWADTADQVQCDVEPRHGWSRIVSLHGYRAELFRSLERDAWQVTTYLIPGQAEAFRDHFATLLSEALDAPMHPSVENFDGGRRFVAEARTGEWVTYIQAGEDMSTAFASIQVDRRFSERTSLECPRTSPDVEPEPFSMGALFADQASRPSANVARVRIRQTVYDATGGLPVEEVDRVIRGHMPAVERCFEQTPWPAEPGSEIAVRVHVGADGMATDIRVDSTLGQGVRACVDSEARRMQFPASGDGAAIVTLGWTVVEP